MLWIERHSKWFLQARLLSGDRPFRRHVSVIVKTPHSNEYPRRLHGSLNTRHRNDQQFAGRIDRHLIDPIDLRVRSPDDVKRFRVSVRSAIKDQNGLIAAGGGKQIVERIHRDTDRDFILTAEDAVRYGVIDHVVGRRELAAVAS